MSIFLRENLEMLPSTPLDNKYVMTSAEIDNLTPYPGQLVYNSTTGWLCMADSINESVNLIKLATSDEMQLFDENIYMGRDEDGLYACMSNGTNANGFRVSAFDFIYGDTSHGHVATDSIILGSAQLDTGQSQITSCISIGYGNKLRNGTCALTPFIFGSNIINYDIGNDEAIYLGFSNGEIDSDYRNYNEFNSLNLVVGNGRNNSNKHNAIAIEDYNPNNSSPSVIIPDLIDGKHIIPGGSGSDIYEDSKYLSENSQYSKTVRVPIYISKTSYVYSNLDTAFKFISSPLIKRIVIHVTEAFADKNATLDISYGWSEKSDLWNDILKDYPIGRIPLNGLAIEEVYTLLDYEYLYISSDEKMTGGDNIFKISLNVSTGNTGEAEIYFDNSYGVIDNIYYRDIINY